MSRRSPLVTVMVNAAYKAARDLIRDFGEVENLQVSRKGPADFVSAADHRAEETIVAELRRARPKFGFLLEEGGAIEGEDTSNRWVVDPLDGTTNFLHGLPHFCISIGLERDGKPHAGVIYDPIRDELFWAENGTSAFLNNQRLRVSARRTLPTALLATAFPFIARPRCPNHGAIVHRLSGETSGVRRTGLGSARPRLCRRRAPRRFLGLRARALGPRGRRRNRARIRRHRDRRHRRGGLHVERRRVGHQRPPAPDAARGAGPNGRLSAGALFWLLCGPRDEAGIVAVAWLHNLSDRCAAHISMNGESLHMAGRLLGHRRAATTNRYAHLDEVTLNETAERVARETKLKLSLST